MHQPPDPQVSEPRGPAEEAAFLRHWIAEWSKQHPGELHPFDIDPAEWSETLPADL